MWKVKKHFFNNETEQKIQKKNYFTTIFKTITFTQNV